ncbi:cellulose biosynthesis cyclic di-GMP-binding regulatory protein BcsB, partial [Candidatus Roizmanbacteria bacterium]|nr:cellulose biosynthesis cyclic di-GMP-binding regulatory protein BcsB [Candidatus Roizmanbacteria bacterium]
MNNKQRLLNVIITLFLVLLSSRAFSEEQSIVTLKDLGFQKDVALYGITPSQTFFFPVPVAGVDYKNSYLELSYAFSSVLSKSSLIRVSINDVPVYSEVFSAINANPVVRIPLSSVDETAISEKEKPLLKVDLAGYLNITDDRCRDLATQALWVVIKQNTRIVLKLTADLTKNYIADFFARKIANPMILVPTKLDVGQATAAIWVNAKLLNDVKSKNIDYDYFETIKGYDLGNHKSVVIIGDIESLANLPGALKATREEIQSLSGSQITPEDGILFTRVVDSTRILYITGDNGNAIQKAAKTLITPREFAKLLTNFALIRYIEPFRIKTFTDEKYKLTLGDLGYERLQTKGIGSLRITIYFTELEIARALDKLDFYLYSKYTPVRKTLTNGYLNLYMNEVLIESKRLDENGSFNGVYVSIPKYLQKKVNTLDIEFSYFPDEGECMDDLAQFVGEIYTYSYFDITNGKSSKPENFTDFPNSFLTNTSVVLQNNPAPEHLKAAAIIVNSIQKLSRNIEYYPNAITFAEMFNTMDNSRTNFIVVSSDVKFNKESFEYLPVDMNQKFKIVSSSTKQVLFEYTDAVPIAIMQMTRTLTSNDVLIVSSYGEEGKSFMVKLVDQFGQRISSV